MIHDMKHDMWQVVKILSINGQTIHSKGPTNDITKWQTFLTKYGIVFPFKTLNKSVGGHTL